MAVESIRYRAGIKLVAPASAVSHVFAFRHVNDCAKPPGRFSCVNALIKQDILLYIHVPLKENMRQSPPSWDCLLYMQVNQRASRERLKRKTLLIISHFLLILGLQ